MRRIQPSRGRGARSRESATSLGASASTRPVRFAGRRLVVVACTLAALADAALADDRLERLCEAAKKEAAGRHAVCIAKAGGTPLPGGAVDPTPELERCRRLLERRWRDIAASPEWAGTACAASATPEQREVLVDSCSGSRSATDGDVSDDAAAQQPVVDADDEAGTIVDQPGRANVPDSEALTVWYGDATPARVLKGVTFTSSADSAGVNVGGGMPNAGTVILNPGVADVLIPKGYHTGAGRCAGDADLKAGNVRRGVSLFGVTGAFTGGQLVQTGQTSCSGGTGSVIACTQTGQDGETRKGFSRSFTDNGNGTVTDTRTSLVWEKLSDDGGIHDWNNRYTFSGAMTQKVAALNAAKFGGYSDWRVPNRIELATIVNHERALPSAFTAFHNSSCTPGCSATTCSCTGNDPYWSSSSYFGSAGNGWLVYFAAGGSVGDSKGKVYPVRAVRGG